MLQAVSWPVDQYWAVRAAISQRTALGSSPSSGTRRARAATTTAVVRVSVLDESQREESLAALRHAAGQAGYAGGFMEHYLLPLIYPPGLTRSVQIWIGIAVLAMM